MFSLLKKDAEKRERKQLQGAAIVLALAIVLVLVGGLIMLAARFTGTLIFTDSVATARVSVGSYSNVVECEGVVEPIRVIAVTAKTSGTVEVVAVTEGQHVRQGATLFELRDEEGTVQPITASVSGTVMNLRVEPGMTGEKVASLDSALDIADMNVLVGVVKVPEYVAGLLEDGHYVETMSSATPGIEYPGMLTSLTKEKNPELAASGHVLYNARIMFDDWEDLHVGDPLVARISIDDYGEVYFVPATAVGEADGIAFVQIVRRDGTIEQHQVELLGTEDSGQKIIKSDILTPETIVRTDVSE